uniref:DH domain-containing protein n=1 Tax=Schistosoma mansoni TaxID=6183 RepID=A0A5K4FA82_SCHMA
MSSIELKSIILKDPNHYLNLIIYIKWKFLELNNLELYHNHIQSFNNPFILFISSLIHNNILDQSSEQQNHCYSIRSLTFKRREFLIQYDIQWKLFFEKLNFIKVQFEIIKQMLSYCMKQDIHNDYLIDSYSFQSSFMNVYTSLNNMKQFLKSYFKQLKKIESFIKAIEYDSIFLISMTIQHVLTNESKQLINNELCNIYQMIISNVIYCERQINCIGYLLNRVEYLIREYDHYHKSVIDKISNDFYSVKQIKDYIGILDAFHYWINQVEGEFQAIKQSGDTYTLMDIYYTKETKIYIEPLYESLVVHLKQVRDIIVSRLTNLRSRLTVLNQLQFDFIQHWNYTPSIHRYRTQSLCSNRTLKCPPVKITFRKRSNSSSSLLSSSHSTEINTDHPISLTYFLRKNNLLSNRSSSFLKDKKMIRNDDALITDIIPNFKHSRNSIQSSSSESTSSTLCYSQNEENNSNFKEISTQIIKETLPGVIDSKNSSLDKIMTSPTSICFDEDFNLTHDNNHVLKDWTTKKERLIENFSSFIQEYEICSKNNTIIQTENKLEDRCTTQLHSEDHYFGSVKETSHEESLYASVPSYSHISNDIDASSLSSCSTEKCASFMLNGCSLHTLLSKLYNNLLQITKRFQLSLINFNKNNSESELNIYHNILDDDHDNNNDDETQLSILNPLHSPLIIYLNRMLKYFNTESDKNDLTTIEQNELTLIEHNLTNIWKYFNELILNMKMNSKQFNLDDDFMKLVDNNMVTIYLENTSSNLFDQLIILTNEIYLSIRDLNKYLSKLSSSEHQPFPLPNLWYTLFKTTDLLCIEMMYSRILILIFYFTYKSLLFIYDILSVYSVSRMKNTFKKNSRNHFMNASNNNNLMILLNEFHNLQPILNQMNPSNLYQSNNQQFNEFSIQFTTIYLLNKYNSNQYSINLLNLLNLFFDCFNQSYNFLLNINKTIQTNVKLNYPIHDDEDDDNDDDVIMSNNKLNNLNIMNPCSYMKTLVTKNLLKTLHIFKYLFITIELLVNTPVLTMKELENRYNKNLALFSQIYSYCYRLHLLNESNNTTEDNQPLQYEECKSHIQQQQQITDLINRGLDLNQKLMIWSANCHSLLDRWKRLSIQVDWFNEHIQNLWNRLPETPMPNPPQFKLDYLLLETNKTSQFMNDLKFISPIQVSYNILISANSLDGLLYYKSWIENIFKSFKNLIPICGAILSEGHSLTNELLHLNTINVHTSSWSFESFNNNNNNNNNNLYWNKEFKLFWDLTIEWIYNLLIEFNRQIFYIQLIENCLNDLISWILLKNNEFNYHIKQFHQIQSNQYFNNNLYQNIKKFNKIDLIINDFCVNEKIIQLNNLKLYIEQLNKNKKSFYHQNNLYYSRLINLSQWIIKIYHNNLLLYKQILYDYQQLIIKNILQLSNKMKNYPVIFDVLHSFQNSFHLLIKRFYNYDFKFIQSNDTTDIILYVIAQNVYRQLEIHLPILLELYNLVQKHQQQQLWINYKDTTNTNTSTTTTTTTNNNNNNNKVITYLEQINQCKKYIEILKNIQIDLLINVHKYQQLKLCSDQLFIEIEVFNIKDPDMMMMYTNGENNFFSKYIFTELLNIKKTDESLRKSFNLRLISLKNRTKQFLSISKLTQIHSLNKIINFHKIFIHQIKTNEILNKFLKKLNFTNNQLYNNHIIDYHYSINNNNDQLLICLKSIIIENLIKFYQILNQLIYLYGCVNYLQQINEKFNLIINFYNFKLFVHDHDQDHHLRITSFMLNFLNEIQLLKNYWIYDNNNNDNVTIQTGQSIFQQFINYGQIILNLCQCNMKCFICEYIQLSTKSLLKEFTTIRLTVVEKLEQLYSNLQVHINQYGKFQTFFRSIIHQLKQSKDIYETNIKELLIDNHCICSSYPYGEIVENTNPNLVNPDFNHIPPSLSLMNLAKSACQHTLLSNIKEFSIKSIKESTFSLNKEIFNLIKLTDLYLCRIKHQRIQWINSIEYLQSIQLYSTGLLSFNENKLNLYISQTDYIINLMETIKRTNSINSLNLLPTKSIMSNIKLEYFNHFMKYFIEDNMINKKGMNNKDDCYNCVNSYLLQRFNLLEQNIIHSMKSLFVTTHEHSFKFKLDDIIKQCIHVNSWYNEYIQLEPLFIYVSTHIFTIKSFHQTICSRINNADILPNTILTSDWLILGIRLHQLKSVLHIIMNRWIHIVSLCNNVNALLDNAELSNVMSQIYPQKSGCSHIHRSLRSFNYQEAIDELKKQQILLNSLFLNEDTNCSHDVVNDLVGTFKNSSSPSSIVADEVNDGIIHNCHITNEIFLSSKSQVLCTICHRNPLIDNNIIDVSSINMLINEQVEHLKALNQYKVDDEKNTINFEQNQIYLTTLQRRIDMISEWIIHFIDETVLASSFNDELQENAEIFLDQLVKIEELLQNCLNEYETIIVYHVNDINIKIQLDLSILLINCLQVYINQLTQRIKHECEEILTYIKTNVKCLIEKMKMMLLVDVDDIMFIQYPYHEINQRCTSLNSLKSVYSTKSTNIQEIQFKLLYMTCIHNHLVNLCKVVNCASINAHSDTTVLLRQFCCSYTYLNRINKYIEYYNNTHQDESTDSIKLGSSLTLSALDPLQEGMRQKNCIKYPILYPPLQIEYKYYNRYIVSMDGNNNKIIDRSIHSLFITTNLYMNKLIKPYFFINIKQFCQKYTTYILINSRYWLKNYYQINYIQNQKSINNSLIDLSYFKQLNHLININLYSDVIRNMFTSKDYIFATNNNGLIFNEMNLNNERNQQNHNEQQIIQHEQCQRNQLHECTRINNYRSTKYFPVMKSKCLRNHVAEKEKNTDTSDSFKNSIKSCQSSNRLSTLSVLAATKKTMGNVNGSGRFKKLQNSKHLVDNICSSNDNMDQSRLSNSVTKNNETINSVIAHSKPTLMKPVVLAKKQINKQDSSKTYGTKCLPLTVRSPQNQSQTTLPPKSQRQHPLAILPSTSSPVSYRLSNVNRQQSLTPLGTLPPKTQRQHPLAMLPSSTSSPVSYRLSNVNRQQSSTPLGKPRTSYLSNPKVGPNKYSVIERTGTLQTACLYVPTVEIFHADLSFTFLYFFELVPDDIVEHGFNLIKEYAPFSLIQHLKLPIMNDFLFNYLTIQDIILENDIKPVLPSLFQAESDHSSTTTVRSFNNEIQSNVPDQIGLEKNCIKEKYASVISRKSSDLLINEPSSSTSPSLSSSALLLMDSKHKQLVSKSCTAKSPDYSIDNDNITSKIVIDGYKRSPVKHNPVHKLCSQPSSVVTRKFQSNSDVYDLLSQVKMSLTKVERHLYELDAYHHDDGDDDGRSFHHVNQVGESLSLTHLSTSCDQLKKFLGQLNAYGFRINFTNSSLKSTVPSSSTSVVTTDQDKLLNELNIVWRKLIVGTKKWISKLHYENNLSNLYVLEKKKTSIHVLTNLQLNNFIVSNLSSDELNNIHQTAKPYYINIILKNNDLSTVESTIQNVYNHHAKSLTKLFDLKQITNLQLYPDPVLHDDNEQSNVSNSLTESSNNKIRQIQLHFNLTSSIQRSITQIETTIISNFRNSSNYICIIQTFYQPNKINIKNTFKIVYKRNIHLNNELFINSSLNQISTTFNRNICEINYTNKHDDNNDVSDLDLDGDDDDHHHNSLRHSIYSMNTVFKNNYHYCKLFIQKRLLHNNLPFIHNNNHKLHLFPIYSSPSTSLSSSLPLLSSNVHYSHYQNKSILCRTTSYLSKRLFSSMFIKFLSYFLFLCIILYLIHFLIKSSFSLSDNLIIIHEDNCRQQKSSQIFFYSLLSWIQRISVNGVDESPKTVDIFNENPLTRIWPDKAPPF